MQKHRSFFARAGGAGSVPTVFRTCAACLGLILLLPRSPVWATAGDWPTYMHDNARSGVTSDRLELPLAEHWVYRSAEAPQPAWADPQPGYNEMPKAKFDDALYTVAVGDAVFFGSSVDNSVHALDAATGARRWKYATGGPVRLAPAVDGDRVYFGSDDGKVYALKSTDGALVWVHDAATDPRRVLGNGRVISLWPVRTSVTIEGGRAYCGAGVFPYEGVFMLALNAADGAPEWKSDVVRSILGGFSPQGYLLTCDRGLVVPNGRNGPVFVDRVTGRTPEPVVPLKNTTGIFSHNKGGTYGVMAGQVLYVGTQNTLYRVNTQTGEITSEWQAARRLLATPDTYYVLRGAPPPLYGRRTTSSATNAITALSRAVETPGQTNPPAAGAQVRWAYTRPELTSMVLAGDRLVAGASNEVVILDAASGRELWTARVSGLAVGLTVAHGRLLVSTTDGSIHCFAPGAPPARTESAAATSGVPGDDAVNATADAVLRASGVRGGYALVTGREAGRLALALARRSKLKVTALESDVAAATAARQAGEDAGLPAGRFRADAITSNALPYPEFAANLVVHMPGAGLPSLGGGELLRVLKPCGGVLLSATAPDAEALALWKSAGVVSNAADLARGGAPWTKLIRGALEGSGWWTHCYADAGNTGSSGDQRVKGDLGVLWFGEPGPTLFPDRHHRNVPPLVMNGRVFCQGLRFATRTSLLLCFDEYNGVPCWERELPDAIRLGLPSVSGNLACTADSLFVAAGARCHRLDAATGTTTAVYETPAAPDGTQPDWGYVAVADGILYGSARMKNAPPTRTPTFDALFGPSRFSEALFAVDLASGRRLWVHRAKEIRDSMIACDRGRLFFVENRGEPTPPLRPGWAVPAPARGEADEAGTTIDRRGNVVARPAAKPMIRTVVALDAATGKPLWERETDITGCGRWDPAVPPESAGFRELQALCRDDVLVFGSAFHHHDKPKDEDAGRKVMALSTADGRVLWSRAVGNYNRPLIMRGALLAEPNFYDLRTGEPLQRRDPKTGKMAPWSIRLRMGSCGTLSACDNWVFLRTGSTVWRNLDGDPDGEFPGVRPGCFINVIPAGGIVIQPEASSGCTCSYAVQCTLALSPRSTTGTPGR